jgi:hypothetical protein
MYAVDVQDGKTVAVLFYRATYVTCVTCVTYVTFWCLVCLPFYALVQSVHFLEEDNLPYFVLFLI